MYKNYPTLSSHHIFVIPVGHYFNAPSDSCLMIYSPLANIFFLALPSEAAHLESALHSGDANEIITSLLQQKSSEEVTPYDTSYSAAGTLYLILNEKCNFHCRYCYSAGGRSNQEMNMEQIRAMLDVFFAPKSDAPQSRTIMYIGGGEPTLSWPLVEQTTPIAEEKARELGLDLRMRLSTNGSILTDKMLAFYKDHRFDLQFSFDVLPDIQDYQRGKWKVVDRNLKRLLAEDIPCLIRSTITQENVSRIKEMVDFCHKNYPTIRGLICEPVVDPTLFTCPEDVDRYFRSYEKSFVEAVGYARRAHIALMSSSYGSLRQLRERFCYNLICVTPYGTLTTCPNISSPQEDGYDKAIFAHIEPGNEPSASKVVFDDAAYHRLTQGNIHTIEACKSCWARWNCGSGCPNQRRVYSQEIFDATCEHTRRMLLNHLMDELARKHEQKTGRNLFEDISDKLKSAR